jgi:hypothetical protein
MLYQSNFPYLPYPTASPVRLRRNASNIKWDISVNIFFVAVIIGDGSMRRARAMRHHHRWDEAGG